MIYFIIGKLIFKGDNFFILESSNFAFKILTTKGVLEKINFSDNLIKVFTFFYFKENTFVLYGFLDEVTLKLFEMLINVQGIGPKTALNILEADSMNDLIYAIVKKEPDLLAKISGVGKKTAERVVLELHNKLNLSFKDVEADKLNLKFELEEILINLGYQKREIKNALTKIDLTNLTLNQALKKVLTLLMR